MYVLNLSNDKRILSATDEKFIPEGNPKVETLPDGDISDYKYINNDYVYDPLPKPEPPEPFDIIGNIVQNKADIDFVAMWTDTPLYDEDESKNMKNEHSPKFELVRSYYRSGLWSERKVLLAVNKGWITQAEADEILQENKK